MIKLKGGDSSESQRLMQKALGGAPVGSRSTAQNQQAISSSFGRSRDAEETGPTPIAKALGMPSATRPVNKQGGNVNWAAKENRINLGAPVYMKSKTVVKQYGDDDDDDHFAYEDRRAAQAKKSYALGKGSDIQTGDENKGAEKKEGEEEEEEDSDFDDLDEDGEALAAWRASRMAELKKETGRTQEFLGMGHGSYREIVQDDFLKEVTKSKYVVCHFFHHEFERCKIIDKHLQALAPKHLATKFVKINASKAPFFVGKLQVKVLPTIVFFKDGIARDRLVGFDDLGASDDFATSVLEKRIEKAGVIVTLDKLTEEELEDRKAKAPNSIRSSKHERTGENVDSDGDED